MIIGLPLKAQMFDSVEVGTFGIRSRTLMVPTFQAMLVHITAATRRQINGMMGADMILIPSSSVPEHDDVAPNTISIILLKDGVLRATNSD